MLANYRNSSEDRIGYYYDLLFELVVSDLKVRYKRSILGLGWSLLNPLVQLMVYRFVFGVIFASTMPNFGTFLFIGILAYGWFHETLLLTTETIIANRTLINRPGFPSGILPVVRASSQLIHFILAIPIVFIILLLEGGTPINFTLALLPVIIFIQFLFTISVGYIASAVYVQFRDLKYLLNLFLQLFFFLTPIIYTVDIVPENLLPIYRLNPMLHIIEAYRSVLLEGKVPELVPLLIILAASIALVGIGYRTFVRAVYVLLEEN